MYETQLQALSDHLASMMILSFSGISYILCGNYTTVLGFPQPGDGERQQAHQVTGYYTGIAQGVASQLTGQTV